MSAVEPNAEYPSGTVRALLETDLVTPQTRAVLRARLDDGGRDAPRCLDPRELTTLRAACARLLPQPHRARPVDLAACIDRRLATGTGDGWRYAAMPPDREAYRLGLRGLNESAHALFGGEFATLDGARQDAVLLAVQRGTAAGPAWEVVPPGRFFEELLVGVAECYYSHPLAQEEIGYVGMADVPGWHALGLDEREPREPLPVRQEVPRG